METFDTEHNSSLHSLVVELLFVWGCVHHEQCIDQSITALSLSFLCLFPRGQVRSNYLLSSQLTRYTSSNKAQCELFLKVPDGRPRLPFLLFAMMYRPNNEPQSQPRMYCESWWRLGRICFIVVSTLHVIEGVDNMHLEAC